MDTRMMYIPSGEVYNKIRYRSKCNIPSKPRKSWVYWAYIPGCIVK